MKLEDICCSLELAKKLKEIGIKQESLFSWFAETSVEVVRYYLRNTNEYYLLPNKDDFNCYSAFTVSELLNMLPDTIIMEDKVAKMVIGKDNNTFRSWYINFGWNIYIPLNDKETSEISDTSFSNTLAKFLLYFLGKNLLSVEEINERI